MKKVSFKKLPHQEHADFLDDLEIMAEEAYDFVIKKMMADLLKILKYKKLAKSDDLKRGWTRKVPKIEVNFDDVLDRTLSRYLDAMKYVLLGNAAGPKARGAAKAIGLDKRVIPGILQSAYLDSIDTHREHTKKLTGEDAKTIPKDLVRGSMDQITKRTSKFADESLLRLRNRIVSAIELEAAELNDTNVAQVQEHSGTLKEAAKNITDKLDVAKVAESVEQATKDYKTRWNQMVNADLSLASAVGTHQAVAEIYGADDDDVRVAWIAMRDEKTCEFCKKASRHPDGSFKLYKLSDFKPAGYNYGKKKQDWKLCIPPFHPNCRCNLVYIPKGFVILNNGDVVPAKKRPQ